MDPRLELDERLDRLERGQVPFVESYRETVLEPQPLGKPHEREIIVVRIDKSKLKFYSALVVFVILGFVIAVVSALRE
ncbi:hypothetical protein N181_01740 [Sinorhizobium fredii USDA 205]|uniref:Uncharacterized protein n=1 Tax=Rhizobium fredii TaxID=380 RepID=A0A844AFR0_RHIFR|nr:hypothetical protein [Sinorhizobium fredii]KSV87349.1 hypothetical protein N181_01740 [Sinorhizobium fredii USDA 205]MQX11803.1 hypothetical protein [Sinorhizobium fredii]